MELVTFNIIFSVVNFDNSWFKLKIFGKSCVPRLNNIVNPKEINLVTGQTLKHLDLNQFGPDSFSMFMGINPHVAHIILG